MTRSTKTLMTAALVVAATLAGINDLHAGGCHSRSYGGGYRAPYYYPPTYRQPTYRPVTRQPVAQPQLPPQGQPQVPPQGQPQQQIGSTGQPNTAAPTQQPSAAAPNASAEMTALQALAAMTGSQPQQQGQQSPATPSPAPAAPAQTQAAPSHVGTWTSDLSNGARVQLSLQADGSFSWTATSKSGKVSAFQGTYTLQNGSLTLNRANDNRKLAGTMTSSNNNSFNFKLSGAKDAGLNFVRG